MNLDSLMTQRNEPDSLKLQNNIDFIVQGAK